jgi:hypothetical protein
MSGLTNPDPDTDPTRRRSHLIQLIQRLEKRSTALAVLAGVTVLAIIILAIIGAALVLSTQARLGRTAVFTYGVSCLIVAGVFIVAACALAGHYISAQTQLAMMKIIHALDDRRDERMAGFETKLAEITTELAQIARINERLLVFIARLGGETGETVVPSINRGRRGGRNEPGPAY